jgi:hypothetical protein
MVISMSIIIGLVGKEITMENFNYEIKAEVNQVWFDILKQITKHQDGFVWENVKPVIEEK